MLTYLLAMATAIACSLSVLLMSCLENRRRPVALEKLERLSPPKLDRRPGLDSRLELRLLVGIFDLMADDVSLLDAVGPFVAVPMLLFSAELFK